MIVMMDKWKTYGSIEIEETVSVSDLTLDSGGISPVLSSFGNSSNDARNEVCPFAEPRLMNRIPIRIALIIPTVAEVIANEVASSHPFCANVAPIAAAVPCPPTNPAASNKPKPSCKPSQNGLSKTRSQTASPPPHIRTIASCE